MTNCLNTTNEGREKLSEAIHPYDFTCRPQILLPKKNKEYENLIKEFGKLTGIFGLLNTSLNVHGYPIVGDEKEAINVFKKTQLDGLLLENYFIEKKI